MDICKLLDRKRLIFIMECNLDNMILISTWTDVNMGRMFRRKYSCQMQIQYVRR